MSCLREADAIVYLMRRKFPLYEEVTDLYYGDRSGLDHDERIRYLRKAADYENELRDLPLRTLRGRVRFEQKREMLEQENEAAAEEAKRPFNQPEATADYEHLVTFGWWSAEEAIAVFLGKSPTKVTWSNIEPYVGISPLAEEFCRLRERVLRSPLADQPDKATPHQWIEWAICQGIALPAALVETAKAFGLNVRSCEEDKRRIVELERALAEAQEALRRPEQEIETRLASERPLGKRQRDSYLHLIIAMAINLDYKPDDGRKLFPKITNTLELLGLRLSIDTVRTHVRAAEELLPRTWYEKWETRRR